jgi:hypothetical protein
MKTWMHSSACGAFDDEGIFDPRGCTCTESPTSQPTEDARRVVDSASTRGARPSPDAALDLIQGRPVLHGGEHRRGGQAMTVTEGITVSEVAMVAQAIDGESLEQFVNDLPAAQVPIYLARLVDAATNIRALTHGLEARLVLDGRTGAHFEIDGVKYGFFGALQKGWRDIPNLIANLMRIGMSPLTLSHAISEMRVTDLRAAASALSDAEKRSEALELIEGARIEKGERGAPRFQVINEQYLATTTRKGT